MFEPTSYGTYTRYNFIEDTQVILSFTIITFIYYFTLLHCRSNLQVNCGKCISCKQCLPCMANAPILVIYCYMYMYQYNILDYVGAINVCLHKNTRNGNIKS